MHFPGGFQSIDHNGWRAVCPWPGPSFTEAGTGFGDPIPAEKLTELDAKGWELYHVAEDFAENHNIAEGNLSKLIEMIAAWYVEAGKYHVLPVDGRGTLRMANERPQITKDRTRSTLYPHAQAVPFNAGPRLLNRTHRITADVEIPSAGATGALVSFRGVDGGHSLYVKDNRLHMCKTTSPATTSTWRAPFPSRPGLRSCVSNSK